MTYVVLGIFVGLVVLLGYATVAMVKEATRREEREVMARERLERLRRESETMLKERSVEDVARDLDSGEF